MGKKESKSKKKASARVSATPKRLKASKTNIISSEDIRARAAKIYEERVLSGRPGDELSDWMEAERILSTGSLTGNIPSDSFSVFADEDIDSKTLAEFLHLLSEIYYCDFRKRLKITDMQSILLEQPVEID